MTGLVKRHLDSNKTPPQKSSAVTDGSGTAVSQTLSTIGQDGSDEDTDGLKNVIRLDVLVAVST